MKKILIPIIVCALLLSGCWDAKDIVEMQYITAIGIDYNKEKEEYILYAQVVSFAGVAKSEQAATVPSKVWVAKGQGKSMEAAMNEIYDKSNQIIYWAHIGIIIFHERLLQHGIDQISDSLARFQQIRETNWMYGTKDSIEDILLVTSLFSSAVQTTLFNPEEVYHVHSIISPIRMHRFYSDFTEKATTTKLPMISVKEDVWTTKGATNDSAKNAGVFLLKGKKYLGNLPISDFRGLRWVTKTTKRSPLRIKTEDNDEVNIIITKLDPHLKINKLDKDKFDVDVSANGGIIEVHKEISLPILKEKITEKMEKEIRESYENALKIKADLYNLEELVYRKDYDRWKNDYKGRFTLTEDSLANINIDITITKTGEYDYQFSN
ncbi:MULTISPECIES: Ger(x)C family spore germination protein [Cytobacillus]|uniref:Ger(X)C family spore germination protein n=1 Tax=Cytobacillus stercorigallinarum TaxID=2762240 RepID=A0ABR8QSI3_9BACI|nr:Ger(x)C family spore germination protein [Cytobacillus stercorigallinarum]MBD7938453.1 Ger(x)C family spore germination protein [Cytobacillus stercorigallinarum]